MTNHLAIAEAFVQEVRQSRQNIVAILLTGSVARQQSAPFSDIDLIIIVPESQENEVSRRGVSTWRDGIYIDAGLVPQSNYAQLERLLGDPRAAMHIAYGMILYDPTGFLAALQAQVQEQFMRPHWLNVRVQSVSSQLQARIERLRAAIETQDALQICIQAGRVFFGTALVPLLQRGIAPSSTRNLMQLAEISPEMAASLYTLEGSAEIAREEVEAAYDIFARLSALGDTSRWGELPVYMVRKVEWMIHNGLEKAAIHTMWINVGFRINDCLATPDVADETQRLAEAWLHKTGWMGEPALSTRLQMAIALIDQVNITSE